LLARSSSRTGSRPSAENRSYPDFDSFAARMIANMRFNGYSEEAVLAPAVRRRFEETHAAHDGRFDQPVRIDCFGPATASPLPFDQFVDGRDDRLTLPPIGPR
jgi:hypothetical protein